MALISAVLQQLGVTLDRQRILADGVAGSRADPTKSAIEQMVREIIDESHKGDVLIAYFAGHGSRQPAAVSPREPDGFDEIFLPLDIGKWDNRSEAVEGAINDKTFAGWFDEFAEKGVFVWAIFDTCHAATLSRSAGPMGERETSRAVPPEFLGIPMESRPLAAAEATVARESSDRAYWVSLYASQSDEVTPEFPLPRDSGANERRVHGLFTYMLAEALSAGTARTPRELVQQVRYRYAQLGRLGPNPDADGDLDWRLPFDRGSGRSRAVRGQHLVTVEDAGWRMEAGLLHGVRRGDLFVAGPGPGTLHEGEWWPVRVTDVTATTSLVTLDLDTRSVLRCGGDPASFAGQGKLAGAVLWAARCGREAGAIKVGPPRYCATFPAVGNDVWSCPELPPSTALAAGVFDAVSRLGAGNTRDPGDWDLTPIVHGGETWLVPGIRLHDAPRLPALRIPVEPGPGASGETDFGSRFASLVLMRRLVSVAGEAYGAPPGVEVAVRKRYGGVPSNCAGRMDQFRAGSTPTLVSGSHVQVNVTNGGRHPVDVLILSFAGDGLLTPLYPSHPGEHNRLPVGGVVSICGRIETDQPGLATWMFIAIVPAVRPLTPRLDLASVLPSLASARGLAKAENASLESASVMVYHWVEE